VEEARLRLQVAQRAVETAAERLRFAEGRYRAGTSDIIELDDAQVGMTNAQAQLVQARYDQATAQARLIRAVGGPAEERK
jgi:outer membrane protein